MSHAASPSSVRASSSIPWLSPQEAARLKRKRATDWAFGIAGAVLLVLTLSVLVALVGSLVHDGWPRLTTAFFEGANSRRPEKAGIRVSLVGTCLVMLVTATTAIPLGIAAGVYLEEYARKNRLTSLIEINTANLAGVPSIIWGLIALGVFVYQLGMGRSILTAGLTLGLLVLPIIIVSTREAIRAVPQGIREASYACGATKLQTVWHHILPCSLSGVLTGSIIALSRAIGETAPLITIGALTFVTTSPPYPFKAIYDDAGAVVAREGLFAWAHSQFTVLPIQMYQWVSRPEAEFKPNAAAAGLVLIVLTLSMNAVAIVLRYRLRKRIQW
jgi:phosphate transport system permease protein